LVKGKIKGKRKINTLLKENKGRRTSTVTGKKEKNIERITKQK
jgi:hypothetical protein